MNQTTHESYYKIIISWVSVLLWMIVIFVLSAQVADESSELSSGVTDLVLNIIQTLTPFVKLNLDTLHFFIRKGAHFTAYFILGILTFNALIISGISKWTLIRSFLICVFYAISDEIHQLFVPGRSGQVTDVLIDSTGSLTGISVFKVIRTYLKLNH